MSLWETQLGHDLARVMINFFSRAAEALEKKEKTVQEAEFSCSVNVTDKVTSRLNNGWKLVQAVPSKSESYGRSLDGVTLIFEKVTEK